MAQVQRKDAGRTEATEARIGAMSWPKGGFTAAARAEAKKSAADASELRGKVATLEAKGKKAGE